MLLMGCYSLRITYSCNHLLHGRDCGWRSVDPAPVDADPCSVCLERRCTVAAEGTFALPGSVSRGMIFFFFVPYELSAHFIQNLQVIFFLFSFGVYSGIMLIIQE